MKLNLNVISEEFLLYITDIINEITDGDYQLLETRELDYRCNCSKERFEKGLKSLGKAELLDILNTDKKAEITCNFCNNKYEFDENNLKRIISSIPDIQ